MLVRGGFLLEFFVHDGKKVLWEVVKDHVVEEPNDHEEIGPQGFDFNFSTKMRRVLLEKSPVSFHIY